MKTPRLVTWLAFGACALLFVSGCATPVAKITQTPSGNPEVIIETTDVRKIKSAIINHLVNQGFSVERDSDYLLEMSKAPTAGENFFAAMVVGNSFSTNRVLALYTLVQLEGKTRVILTLSMRAQMPGGKVSTQPIGTEPAMFNQFQTGLFDLKKRVEAGTPASALHTAN